MSFGGPLPTGVDGRDRPCERRGAVQRRLPTAVVVTRGESALSVVLGVDAIAFLQWMEESTARISALT
jgi:hypothetical protein